MDTTVRLTVGKLRVDTEWLWDRIAKYDDISCMGFAILSPGSASDIISQKSIELIGAISSMKKLINLGSLLNS